MEIKIPDSFLGKPIKGAMQKILQDDSKGEKKKGKVVTAVAVPSPSTLTDAEKYLILPSAQHGSYSYPDLLVSMERTHLNKTWTNAHKALRKDNSYMLTIRQFADFLNLLKSGNAFDGTGKKADKNMLEKVLDDIVKVENPYRAEWLDARFDNGSIFYHVLDGANYKEVSEPLSNYIKSDKTPGIDLDDWLDKANNHGLPAPKTNKGKLYYWAPEDGKVAWFNVYSVRAYLDCGEGPSGSYASLGVRAVREKI